MLTVFHPRAWTANWPKGAKPYATAELCAGFELTDDIVETPFAGQLSDIITDMPPTAKDEPVTPPQPSKKKTKK